MSGPQPSSSSFRVSVECRQPAQRSSDRPRAVRLWRWFSSLSLTFRWETGLVTLRGSLRRRAESPTGMTSTTAAAVPALPNRVISRRQSTPPADPQPSGSRRTTAVGAGVRGPSSPGLEPGQSRGCPQSPCRLTLTPERANGADMDAFQGLDVFCVECSLKRFSRSQTLG